VPDLNRTLFLALNAGVDGSPAIAALAVFAAKYLTLLVPVLLCALWVRGDRPQRRAALTCLLALLIALAMNQAVGLLAYSPRPFLVGLGHTLLDHRPSSSFPSNHGTVCFTAAAVLVLSGNWRLAWATAGLGLLVAWSRIYVGIHYPLDMLGAAPSAALAGLGANWAMSRMGEELLGTAEGTYRLAFRPLIRLGLVRY
jgi:undecaprenyl-diphosphatase